MPSLVMEAEAPSPFETVVAAEAAAAAAFLNDEDADADADVDDDDDDDTVERSDCEDADEPDLQSSSSSSSPSGKDPTCDAELAVEVTEELSEDAPQKENDSSPPVVDLATTATTTDPTVNTQPQDASSTSTKNNNQRNEVTPNNYLDTAEMRDTKKKQQKKVNQMNLSAFFHKVPPGQKPPVAASRPLRSPVDFALKARPATSSSSPSAAPRGAATATTKAKQETKKRRAPSTKRALAKESNIAVSREPESMEVASSSDKSGAAAAEPSSSSTKAKNAAAPAVGNDTPSAEPMTVSTESSPHDLPVPHPNGKEQNVVVSKEGTGTLAPMAKKPRGTKDTAATKSVLETTAPLPNTKKSLSTSAAEINGAKPQQETGKSDDPKSLPETAEPVLELSEERKELLQKHADMKTRCQQRFEELVHVAREGLDDEDFEMPALEDMSALYSEADQKEEFSDAVVKNMALLIEGSTLPLSKLTSTICQKLHECHSKRREWSEDSVSTKIKVIAERKAYLEIASTFKNDVVGKYEDDSVDRMWRWEFGILEVLPSDIISKVRKARSARRKVLQHYMTNHKLLKSLEDADAVVRDMKTEAQKLESVLGKVSKDEEKVLKYDRDAEKQRLAQLVQRTKNQESEAKRKEKERKKEEAESKRLDKEKEKIEAAEAREAEKRKKTQDKEREQQKKQEKEQQKKQVLNRQKACLMSFFATNSAPTSNNKESSSSSSDHAEESSQAVDCVKKSSQNKKWDSTSNNEFDSDHFRSLIASQTPIEPSCPLFPSLSNSAIQSRKRRTRKIPVSVYVTVMPESNGFDEQPFAEQQIIHIPNKYRFLSFHEDYRPPYHGTWSKRSKIITGRTPLHKDTTYLDYDYDSEAEWEEGDDEIGEDVDDDAKNQEDEEDEGVAAKMYDYDDGFCVADDQYLDIDEDIDEETKALYRKKLQRGDDEGLTGNRICIIGPAKGGTPASDISVPELMDGFEKGEVKEFLAAHTGKQLCQDLLWLDAFAPDNIDDVDPTFAEKEKPGPGTASASSNRDEHTVEEMKTLATFAHHCTLNSKDKLIEELRNANPDAFGSRAKVTRKLDSIAEKKKHPSGTGVYWEVNQQVLEELHLGDVLAKKLPVVETPQATATKAPSKPAEKKTISKTTSLDSLASTATTKKRKNPEASAASPEPAGAVAVKKAKKAASSSKGGSGTTKTSTTMTQTTSTTTKPASRKQPCPSLAASASAMMNFLQPRKKAKVKVSTAATTTASTVTEAGKP